MCGWLLTIVKKYVVAINLRKTHHQKYLSFLIVEEQCNVWLILVRLGKSIMVNAGLLWLIEKMPAPKNYRI